MAATLLNSPRANELGVYVVHASVELRGMLASNRELAGNVNTLERKVSQHERHIAELVDSIAELLAAPAPPPKRSIGFLLSEDQKDKLAGIGKTGKAKKAGRGNKRFAIGKVDCLTFMADACLWFAAFCYLIRSCLRPT